jgi:hypothetical protein
VFGERRWGTRSSGDSVLGTSGFIVQGTLGLFAVVTERQERNSRSRARTRSMWRAHDVVVCLSNGQRGADTRRVHPVAHARARTGIRDTWEKADLQGKRGRSCPAVAASSAPLTSMVRSGSTGRVRKRALQRARKTRPFLSNELARAPVCARYGAVYGALRSKTRVSDQSRLDFGAKTG